MKWNIKNENKGFTLIELILSVAILAFVVAPFLSSFLVANNQNAASKRKQEATDIGQLLAEEFKAMDFQKLKDGYTPESDPILDEDGSETGRFRYRFTLDNEDLPGVYNEAYNAVVTLEPSMDPRVAADVNGEKTPIIKNADSEEMAVFLTNFYTQDRIAAGASANHRECTVTISKRAGTETYDVSLSVKYRNISGDQVLAKEYSPLSFTDIKPEIYLIYTPMSNEDTLIIDNTISPSTLGKDEDGNEQKINVYLATQNEGGFHLNPYNVTIKFEDNNGILEDKILGKLQENPFENGDSKYGTTTTWIYTNVIPTGMENSGIENLVSMINKDTLYNMKVVVNYNEDPVATINSAKNISDKGDVE